MRKELNLKAQMIQYISDIVYDVAETAVETSNGHGKRYLLCGSHADIRAKERTFR